MPNSPTTGDADALPECGHPGAELPPGAESLRDLQKSLMPNAMWCPGGLHILHTATEDITSSMEGFNTFLTYLGALTKFLDRPYLRERFIAQFHWLPSLQAEFGLVPANS